MQRYLCMALLGIGLWPRLGYSQDAKATLESIAKAMGATELTSLQYSGSGSIYAVGQNPTPTAPWPRFHAKSYTRSIHYGTASMRDDLVRMQAEPSPRGGGGQPIIGEQRQIAVVSGTHAWNQTGENIAPVPLTVPERLQQLWITPHGVVKAAIAHQATVQAHSEGERKLTAISFTQPGALKVKALVNDKNLVEKVESWTANPVLGDFLTETTYTEYKDFAGVQFPTKIVQKQGGFASLELTISEVKPQAAVDIQVPEAVQKAAIRVEANKVADGVWYLTGGTHHSVLVEMQEYALVIEGPQYDARAEAVLAEVKRLVPNKPLKYVVNTHHHFDHAGGLGAFVAEGAIVVTHDVNKEFLEKSLAAPRTLQPDKLAQSGKKASVEGMTDKRVFSDTTRTVELYLIQGSLHHDGMIMAYLPKEKLLVEADAYTPAPANTPPPAQPNPFSVNLHENIERLKLSVEQILPLHGRQVPFAELLKAIGKSS